jgi:TATA-binding protein-associated factor Taf7
MNTKQIILNKLKNARKQELSKKVDLSLVDDIENEVDRFEEAESAANYLAYDLGDEVIDAYDEFRMKYSLDDYIINGAVRDLEEVAEILQGYLTKLETSAEELGIPPYDIYFDYEDLKQRVANANQLNNEAKRKYQEVVDYTGFNDFWN